MTTYLLVLGCGTILSLGTTVLAMRLAPRIGAVDLPGPRKVHTVPIPRIGGLAILFAMAGAILLGLVLDRAIATEIYGDRLRVVGFFCAALFICFVGLVDDIRPLRARHKLAAQLVAATVLCAVGVRIHALGVGQQIWIELGWLSWPLTLLWIIGITNAVNLIDGLDGLAGGISTITALVIAAFAFQVGSPLIAVVMVAMLGALAGFLFFNCNPARIYLGDCGSLLLGFVLAGSSVFAFTRQASAIGLALPLLALGVPIADTLLSMTRRLLERRSLFGPDRQHIHHALMKMGLKHSHAVLVLCAISALSASLGLFMMVSADVRSLVVFLCVLLLLALSLRATGVFSLRKLLFAFRHKARLSHEAKKDKQVFEEGLLRLRDARSTGARWRVITKMAEQIGATHLVITRRDGRDVREIILCHHDPDMTDGGQLIHLSVPLPDRPAGQELRAELAIRAVDSLEVAGRRLALLGRLIDESVGQATWTMTPSQKDDQPSAGHLAAGEEWTARKRSA